MEEIVIFCVIYEFELLIEIVCGLYSWFVNLGELELVYLVISMFVSVLFLW